MATPIQRIEKEYFLGALNSKAIPLKCLVEKHEYSFTLRNLDKDRLIFESKEHLSAFRKETKIELKFSAQSAPANIITFSVYVYEVADRRLITSIPDYLYKNLSRFYSRVQHTSGLNMVIQKDSFYYDLNYEKISGVDLATFDHIVFQLNKDDVNAAMHENLNWIQQKTDGYKLVLFKDNVPSSALSIEEKAVGKLGKILFISVPAGGLLSEEENTGGMFFTEHSLTEYLLSNGESPASAREKIVGLIRQRAEQNICSDCYIPVIFFSYIIGYMHIWVNEGENTPLSLSSIEKFCQFAKIIAFSLERNNYFADGKKEMPPFIPKLLDISVGGFLFALYLDKEEITYALNDHFSVQITISGRGIRCNASVVRVHSDKTYAYYGCKFEGMAIEDIRFLFEAIYGKPFTDNDIQFVAGAV
jgi:hypothetical protein